MRAEHAGGHRQAFHAGDDGGRFLVVVVVEREMQVGLGLRGVGGVAGGALGLNGFQRLHAGAGDFLLGHVEQAEQRADRVGDAFLDANFRNHAVTQGGHAHDRLVGFHLDDFLIGADDIADRHAEADDGGLGDGLAELRHEDGDGGHFGRKAEIRKI